MILRRATWVLTLPLLLALPGCGAEPGLGFGVELQHLQGGEVIQLIVLQGTDTGGDAVSCAAVARTCVADQPTLRVVPLKIDGAEVRAHRIPIDTAAATGVGGQSLTLPGIPPGSGYLLAVELGRDDGMGEQRVGNGCAELPEIVRGDNDALAEPIVVTESADGCNPAI
ncbi:MAG: hypothetical protein P1V51_22105 [Deltaproteobacteria bacterium]|nr:hypothetical protein [Deltaproteobacteria bacterium]